MVDMNLPAKNEGYGTKEYWEQRYEAEGEAGSFDWFLQPAYLMPFLEDILNEGQKKQSRILMLGCGNSLLSEVMYDAGYHAVTNIDYSATLIAQMQSRYSENRPEMIWKEMDIRSLDFVEGDFDVVIDKGTMDALLTSAKSDVWNPPEQDVQNCRKEVQEAVRVMEKRTGSRFLYFSFAQPHFRKQYMQNQHPRFTLAVKSIGPPEGFDYFMYDLKFVASDAQS